MPERDLFEMASILRFPSLSLPSHLSRITLQRFKNFSMTSTEAQTVNTTKRLTDLRELMKQKENSVQAYVVLSEDQRRYHLWRTFYFVLELNVNDGSDSSEYLAHCDERRGFISGFTGSSGQ